MTAYVVRNVKQYINGEFLEAISNNRFSNISPFTNTEINQVAEGEKEDIDLAVGAARQAFDHEPWRALSVKERLG